MHLIEILLPLHDNSRPSFEADEVRHHLMRHFGGLTAFTRSPAQGTTTESGKPEVMTEALDIPWWGSTGFASSASFAKIRL